MKPPPAPDVSEERTAPKVLTSDRCGERILKGETYHHLEFVVPSERYLPMPFEIVVSCKHVECFAIDMIRAKALAKEIREKIIPSLFKVKCR